MSTLPTLKQIEVLRCIAVYQAQHDGVAPTLAEIGRTMGKSTGSVYDHLAVLRRKGLIEKESNRARGLKLTRAAVSLFNTCPCCGASLMDGRPARNLTQEAGDGI